MINWGFSGYIPNNSTLDVWLPCAYTRFFTVLATHFWASGDFCWNHVVAAGQDQLTFIRLINNRVVGEDTRSFVASYLTVGV